MWQVIRDYLRYSLTSAANAEQRSGSIRTGFRPPRLPESLRAYSSERGVIWVITFTSSIQVSGFGCQISATEFGSDVGVAHEMDFFHRVWDFRVATKSVLWFQASYLPTPETH